MAISYTVSFTFSPSTTISSSQVNTNFSDNANVWVGLEAKTKTFSNLGVDTQLKSGGTVEAADGSITAPSITFTSNTATGLYLSGSTISLLGLNGWRYRRPILQYATGSTVVVEAGLDGTAGNVPMLFPDGTLRTETSTTRTTFNTTRNAVLTTAGAQSGMTGATTVANNTWYALYACKVTDSNTLWCTVGSTVLPLRANYATLNTAYGTNGWVYLGMVRYGDGSGTANAIVAFAQSGNFTMFKNTCTGNGYNSLGVRLATTAGATTLSYAAAYGTSGAVIPDHCANVNIFSIAFNAGVATQCYVRDTGATGPFLSMIPAASVGSVCMVMYSNGPTGGAATLFLNNSAASSIAQDIYLTGYSDSVLGVGPNPLL